MSKVKLAIVSTHPIQYYAPLFKALSQGGTVHPRVFYTWSQVAEGAIQDRGFSRDVTWDVPLLDGYEYEFVENVAQHPTPERFWGIRNPTLTRRLREWGPDAVLVFGWRLYGHLRAMLHFAGRVPVLFRGDSTLLDKQPAVRDVFRTIMLRWVYRHVNLALAVGQNNRDYFIRYGVPPSSIAVAPHSVDVQRFAASDAAHDEEACQWRRQLGIPDDVPVVLYAGKFQPKKDVGLLLAAFIRSGLRAHLVLVGGGELEDELRGVASGHTRIHFCEFRNQRAMPTVYRVGDVFVLPSCGPGETWGLVLNEAMASGRPIIASSKVGAARDLVREGVTGWRFEAGQVDSLQRVLERAVGMGRGALLAMGREAQQVIAGWSTEATARRISEAIVSRVAISRPTAPELDSNPPGRLDTGRVRD